MNRLAAAIVISVSCGLTLVAWGGQSAPGLNDLDARVTKFLEQHRNDWHDLNVPESDGQQLHDLVIKGGYKRALEIGTSTGRSGIWKIGRAHV